MRISKSSIVLFRYDLNTIHGLAVAEKPTRDFLKIFFTCLFLQLQPSASRESDNGEEKSGQYGY